MTFNELFSKIGNTFGNFFNYLGNTPIEDLFTDLFLLFTSIVIFGLTIFIIIGGFNILGSIFNKIFPNQNSKKHTPLEKQPMYKLGKKLKKFLGK